MLWLRAALLGLLGSLVILACAGAAPGAAQPDFRVLVFSKTAEYRHDSIPAAIATVEQLGAQNDFAVDATEDATAFSTPNLAHYAVVVFLLTTGDVLDSGQQAAFTQYIQSGGAFVGVHSASDTELDWPWYGGLVGAAFTVHSEIQPAVVDVVDHATPSTLHLPAHWPRTDEWYAFQANPRPNVTVLTTVDETTYDPGAAAIGSDHPISWQHVYDGGRSWYTAMGHASSAYSEPLFVRFLLGGILWAAGYDLPKLQTISAKVANRHLQLTTTHPKCEECTEAVSVQIGKRLVKASVSAAGTRTQLRTAALPRGRWRYSVVLEDERMDARATAGGTVRVG